MSQNQPKECTCHTKYVYQYGLFKTPINNLVVMFEAKRENECCYFVYCTLYMDISISL